MTFTNLPLSWEEIPTHRGLNLHQVEPPYLKVMYWQRALWLVLLLIVVCVVVYFNPSLNKPVLIGSVAAVFIVFATLLFFTARKAFQNMGYTMRNHDLVYRKGWFYEKLMIIPLNKVQHCQVRKGPLERYYALVSLKIFTAGGTGADITVNGLTQEQAERLKDWLVGANSALATEPENEQHDTMG